MMLSYLHLFNNVPINKCLKYSMQYDVAMLKRTYSPLCVIWEIACNKIKALPLALSTHPIPTG